MKSLDKKSFTLLEIVIVLLIMGLVYTMSITSFSKQNINTDGYYFDLKQVILDKVKVHDKIIELIVFEDYSVLKVDGIEKKQYTFDLPKDMEFFSYWQDDELKEFFEPYYEKGYFKEVLFRFLIYPNGSSTKSIIKLKNEYFIQSNYFRNKAIFNELDEAKEYLLQTDIKQSMRITDE